jgi:outer membrane protein TolC
VQAQVQLVVNFIALQKSLGLGWQQAPVPDAVQPETATR